MSARSSLPDRFWAKVDRTDDTTCWRWLGSVTKAGYGQIWDYRIQRPNYAHRVSYELAYGAIPQGLEIDHLCRNRRCVNPDHLEAVTQAENARRASDVLRTGLCGRGHDQSVYGYTSPKGRRHCLECLRIRRDERRQEMPGYVPRHGYSGYSNYGCRCAICKRANSDHEWRNRPRILALRKARRTG